MANHDPKKEKQNVDYQKKREHQPAISKNGIVKRRNKRSKFSHQHACGKQGIDNNQNYFDNLSQELI